MIITNFGLGWIGIRIGITDTGYEARRLGAIERVFILNTFLFMHRQCKVKNDSISVSSMEEYIVSGHVKMHRVRVTC